METTESVVGTTESVQKVLWPFHTPKLHGEFFVPWSPQAALAQSCRKNSLVL